ncbi:DUF924 family protein [Microvirga terricola]|uniref:DUF924 family protein n=1 Tax=Microvirga terricola TaxID=2719797 RepID=A0ABX0VF15_9HYPH|nr:DUF924 family protein [Microvirga terricola]NIX76467.1 DUF924 family protein [Microvirga terricola]
MQRLATPDEVLSFWREAGPDKWFSKDDAFDHACRTRFLPTYEAVAQDALTSWEATPDGALAVVLLLDQFPRNMFRGTPDVYKTDPAAVLVAQRAIEKGFDRQAEPELRRFFYLPFMHSESLQDQKRSVALNETLGEDSLKWARHHHDIVARFGRFPHRNVILERMTTTEEEAFLKESDFRG